MTSDSLRSEIENLGNGVLLVRFSGSVGVGSAGNVHGQEMLGAIERAISDHSPEHLIIDVSGTNYVFGDWIAGPALLARRQLGAGRVCVRASGRVHNAMSSLWEIGPKHLLPLVVDLNEAYTYFQLKSPEPNQANGLDI